MATQGNGRAAFFAYVCSGATGVGVNTTYDAIIVGAGPAGSTAAILLAAAGWTVALVEKQPFPRRKVCGACISATNLPLLETLGIGDTFAQRAGPELREVALYCGDRVVHAPLPAASNARHPWGRALGREAFDLLLLERAREVGVSVWQPWSLRAIESNGGAWLVDYELEPAELPLNEPFAVELRVRANDAERTLVEGLELRFDARMPEHRHGMRVAPAVRALGEGRFHVEGARLHMPGAWELHFDVTRGAITERAQARVELE